MKKCILCKQPSLIGKEFCSISCSIAKQNIDKINGVSVLVIPDTHAPFAHPHALDFLNEIKKEWKPDIIVHLGDEIDFHAISNHDHDPDGMSPGDEYRSALKWLKDLYKIFPKVKACTSNHTARPFRQAFSTGLPAKFIKEYKELLEAPSGWEWSDRHVIDSVQYIHGEGFTGQQAHIKAATKHMQSTVIGHIHAHAGVQYYDTKSVQIFALNAGWLGDEAQYAFRYSKHLPQRGTLGCGLVMEGKWATFIPMAKSE